MGWKAFEFDLGAVQAPSVVEEEALVALALVLALRLARTADTPPPRAPA